MADNVGYTPGTGATIATDDVGGVHVQRVKNTFGGDGVATDVTATTPMPVTQDVGTLVERMEELIFLAQSLVRGAGAQPPDQAGRMRVAIDQIGSGALQSTSIPVSGTLTGVTTVTTVSAATLTALGVMPAVMPAMGMVNGSADTGIYANIAFT